MSGADPYRAAGVDYERLDAGKRTALTEALATSGLLGARGGAAVDASRGEPAFVFELAGRTFAFVVEGLGTKSMIAAAVGDAEGFAAVAYDTVAAIVNDLCCVGAQPLVVNAYFATGSSRWHESPDRQEALVAGWRLACEDAGAVWGGGESPSLPGLVDADQVELAGSAVGVLPPGARPILGEELAPGDEIVFVGGTGLHANGASLARMVAGRLPDGYDTPLAGGRLLGEALLEHAPVYSPLVERLLAASVPVRYLSHITGHGMLKLMRPKRALGYEITRLPPVPEVLAFLVKQAEMTPFDAYCTFNMGCGFAVYCESGRGADAVGVAESLGLDAWVAGRVEEGSRRVVLHEIGVEYEGGELDLAPSR